MCLKFKGINFFVLFIYMSLIDISELHKKTREQREKKIKIYEEVLKKCHHRILLVSKLTPMNQWCFYLIPKVMFGMPLYNLAECVEYLVRMLSDNGFKVAYTHPNLLLITWFENDRGGKYPNLVNMQQSISNGKSRQNRVSNNSSLSNQNYRSIDSYKPSGNLVYNQNSFNLLEQRKNDIFKR